MGVRSLGQEEPLEKEMETHSSILTWRISWAEEAEWAIVHRVAKSQTRLKWLSTAQEAWLWLHLTPKAHRVSDEVTGSHRWLWTNRSVLPPPPSCPAETCASSPPPASPLLASHLHRHAPKNCPSTLKTAFLCHTQVDCVQGLRGVSQGCPVHGPSSS